MFATKYIIIHIPQNFLGTSRYPIYQWPFQEPIYWRYLPCVRLIFQAYVRGYTPKIWLKKYLHFRILEFLLTQPLQECGHEGLFHPFPESLCLRVKGGMKQKGPFACCHQFSIDMLVGGFNHLEKYEFVSWEG